MRALLLDGSPSGDVRTAAAADALAAELTAAGLDVERLALRDLAIRACTGCFGCWTKSPGQCVIDDDARTIAAKVVAADVFAVATPVSFGGYGSLTKSILDRLICLVLPHFTRIDGEVHHRPRYRRYPRYVALGTPPARDVAEEDVFARLVSRNALNMHNPVHAAAVVADGDDPALVARGAVTWALHGTEVAA